MTHLTPINSTKDRFLRTAQPMQQQGQPWQPTENSKKIHDKRVGDTEGTG